MPFDCFLRLRSSLLFGPGTWPNRDEAWSRVPRRCFVCPRFLDRQLEHLDTPVGTRYTQLVRFGPCKKNLVYQLSTVRVRNAAQCKCNLGVREVFVENSG